MTWLVGALLGGCTPERVLIHDSPARALQDDGKSRPFGPYAKMADPSGVGPAGPSRIIWGSSELQSSVKAPGRDRLAKSGSGPGSYTLNLVDATVADAAAAVLGEIFGANYTVDPKLDSRITLQTTKPTDKAGIGELFEASLRTVGAAVVQNGSVFRVVTADQAAQGARLGASEGAGPGIGNAVKVVPLKYVAAAEMKRILDPIASFGGVVRVDAARNALVLSGTALEIASMQEAISVFDVNVMKGMSFALVPVRTTDPEAMIEDLNKIFTANTEGPMSGMVQFIPNKRLKSVLVSSKQPEYLKEAEKWVRRLDEQAVGTKRQFYTYMLRNRQAKELVEVLNAMFATEGGPGDASRADLASRLRRTATESASLPAPAVTTANAAGITTGQSFSVFGGVPGTGAATLGTVTQQRSIGFPERFGDVPDREGAGGAAAIGAASDGQPRIKIVADPSQNALLILAGEAEYKRIEQVIANLDVVPNQVMIEATIAEVTLNDDLRLGVRWFLQNKSGKDTGIFSSALDGAVSSVFPGFSYVHKALGAQVTLNALNNVTRVNVLASPSLMVLDKKTATLQIGDQVPITTQSAVSIITPGAPVVNSVAYKDTGVILNITPRINESGRVLLDIEQEVSTVSRTSTSNIDSPTFGRRRVKTTVIVNDGQGITLGGLIQDRSTVTAVQVPVLGDIPVLGNAFKDKQNAIEKTELLIMLTPRVVRDLNEAQAVTAEYRTKVEAYTPTRDLSRRLMHNVKRTLE